MKAVGVDATVNLSALDALPPDVQEELARILEQYLADLERGEKIEPHELMTRHPHLAEPLKLYLESLDFLHQAAAELGGRLAPATATPQRRLGDFRIRREIGRGGMGVVYEAEQISMGRVVALKVLPFAAVLDQKQIQRFTNEAQAAGQLNHPHIVPVYSVGCERGVHYYSMQLIDGQPLDRAVADLRSWAGSRAPHEITSDAASAHAAGTVTRKGFTTARSVESHDYVRRVAELGAQAADALHYAHECGIIHRDIKPSNLLVDRLGKLWITDFGLARSRTAESLTISGDVLGTLRYMSPEQAAGRGSLVDHRTDIYSLGVTLYELLTLCPMFEAADRQALLRQIEHDEPPTPRRKNPAIPQDLETIILKAVSKSRDERYTSAQQLSEDLRRFLDGKPTLARRPSLLDRGARWAGRHRAVVATAMAVLLAALAGTTVAALLVAHEQERTRLALSQSQANLRQARQNFRQAQEVVDRFGMHMSQELSTVPGMEDLRHSLLHETLRYYEDFVRQSAKDPALKFDLAMSYSKIGSLRGQLGELQNALNAYRKAEQLYERLAAQDPTQPRFRHDWALCRNNSAHLLEQIGRTDDAFAAYRGALALQRDLVDERPEDKVHQSALALTLSNLGSLRRKTGSMEQARHSYDQAVQLQQELVRRHPADSDLLSQLAASYNELSFLLGTTNVEKAAEYNQLAIETLERLLTAEPHDWRRRAQLAACYNNRGAIFNRNVKLVEARKAYEAGLAIQQELVAAAPKIVQFQNDLATSHNNLGQLLAADAHGEAEEHFRKAQDLFERLIDTSPNSPAYEASLGGVLNNMALIHESRQRPDEASALYERAIAHQEAALGQAPDIVEFCILLSTSYVNYGRLLRQMEEPVQAAELALKRRQLWKHDGQHLYYVAAELATSAALIAKSSNSDSQQTDQRWTDEALATLSQAIDHGFRDEALLRGNESFRALEDDQRYQTLLAQVMSRSKTAKGDSSDPRRPL